ncbi:MAG: D-alanyl-D-alanine carboxypeptidase/D-alanyl-D-alanine-endopeptidase [Planctomycetes bacterium]|nr:D-alanyl-D-alanine carboxypeptidase/D-alanyl-D-alanine-endopeptidase [Planctomycetota bacterium]MCP4838075.1 D-alanyl-D-alanine carboxypeptidase/D-alanyl-D-alanine-endopeptidase [Planctomycetota bacterium]
MHARLSILTALLLVGTAVADLQERVHTLVKEAGFTSREVSVAIRECGSDTLVCGIAASMPRTPASNEKLLTSSVAARVLGSDFQFESRLLRRGNDLVVDADGDPGFGDDALLAEMQWPDGRPMNSTDLLDIWAGWVKASGMTSVDSLIVDDRVFDREYIPDEWPREQLHMRYCAPISGLNFSCNTMCFRPVPAGTRVDASDSWPPWPGIRIVNTMKRGVKGRDKHTIRADRRVGEDVISLSGTVPVPTTSPIEITIEEPALKFGQMLADRLHLLGIDVQTVRLTKPTDPPAAGTPIAPSIVTPLSTVLRRCNHDSYNLYAESLLKRLAHETTRRPGSYADGRRIMTSMIERAVGKESGLHIADGSGMSRLNSISARAMTAWLCTFDPANDDDAAFIDSLPTPGEGTLKNRFKSSNLGNTRVLAKSGYLRRVCALSGYIRCPSGRRFAFSILVNDTNRIRPAKRLQEQIVALVASSQCDHDP